MTRPLRILFMCSEMTPLVGTGGLSEVAYALPAALDAHDHDVRVALPLYRAVPQQHRGDPICDVHAYLDREVAGAMRETVVPGTRIPLYLIEQNGYFDRDHIYGDPINEYSDNPERFCFFSQAALNGVAKTGWKPDIVHCNDWHTAVAPAYLRTIFSHHPVWQDVPSLLTIHNLAYQGQYPAHLLPKTGLGYELFHTECLEFYGDLSLMKAGIAFADRINVVSPQYAQEILHSDELGMGLRGFLRKRQADFRGILNGIDTRTWNPQTDPHIPTNFCDADLAGKADCKKALQKELDLPVCDAPLIGIVTRIDYQKGLDVLAQALPLILKKKLQFVLLGSGDPRIQERLESVITGHDNARLVTRYDIPLSHRIIAASDFYLMPSRFEPCGLAQMYSMAYGTVPIVRGTGGLANTVHNTNKANLDSGAATGIVFTALTPNALVRCIARATRFYNQPDVYRSLQRAGMAEDHSWEKSSREYVAFYHEAISERCQTS